MALRCTCAVEQRQVPDRPDDTQLQTGHAPAPTRLQGRQGITSLAELFAQRTADQKDKQKTGRRQPHMTYRR